MALIEREAFLDEVRKAQESLETDNVVTRDLNHRYNAGLAWASRVALGLPAIDRWISVEEKLPKGHEDVLVVAYWHEHWQTMIGWHCSGKDWRIFTSHGEKRPGGVTHWMPLPSGPEEG